MTVKEYVLHCPTCLRNYTDDGLMLQCKERHEPTLLVTKYEQKYFESDGCAEGIYRYKNWLPTQRALPGAGCLVTYQSPRLSDFTGLPHLWIAFNGHWPEKGASLQTASFKELEAYTVLSRLPEKYKDVLVVSSAGSTAAAFAHLCSRHHLPCLIIVPSHGLHRMQFDQPLDPCVKIITLNGFVDYYDAILLGEQLVRLNGFFPEGGIKNVARRDGLGVTMLNAVEAMGRLPDYYFQAVGSGAGGIAVHAVAKRLVGEGRFGSTLPRLMLSQNVPFAPIYYSWKARKRELLKLDRDEGKKQIQQIAAHVLSNQRPPYSIKGGVFDVLTESGGDMLVANNHEVKQAVDLFSECEGIDIDPAAGVALATLLNAVRLEQIEREAYVLLNITGGGWKRRQQDNELLPATPTLQLEDDELITQRALERVVGLF